jgi:hypothetical protein
MENGSMRGASFFVRDLTNPMKCIVSESLESNDGVR